MSHGITDCACYASALPTALERAVAGDMNTGGSGRRFAAGLAAVAAAAAGWYSLVAGPAEEARPADQQETTEHGLPALARFKVPTKAVSSTVPSSQALSTSTVRP